MQRGIAVVLLLLSVVRLSNAKVGLHDSPTAGRSAAVGEVIATGAVFVNDVKATSGSTVFDGGRLRTAREAMAILALRAGAGVIALLSESEARVREGSGAWVIELVRGTVWVRAREATAVIVEGVRVRSPQGNWYRVTKGEDGVRVEAMAKPVEVQVAGEVMGLAAGRSLLVREGRAQVAPQAPSPQRARRRIVIPALVIGALAVTLALTVARGERSKVVSPVAPQR